MLSGLLLLFAGAAAVPEPVPVNPSQWLRASDLPLLKRLRTRTEEIRYSLEVDARGRPVSCTIDQGSSSPAIDARTCRLLVERAAFTPPTDASGAPVASTFAGRIVWHFADPAKVRIEDFEPGVRRFTLRVASDGTVENCAKEEEGAPLWIPGTSDCGGVVGRASYAWARHAREYGTLHSLVAVMRPGDAPPAIPGATLLQDEGAQLEFRENGRYIRCTPFPGAYDPTVQELCDSFFPEVRTRQGTAETRIVRRRLFGVAREAD